MPITVVAAAAANAGTGTSTGATVTWPGGTLAGDVAIFLVCSNTTTETYTFTGWTQQGTQLSNSTTHATSVFLKVLAGNETGAVGPTLGSARRWAAGVVILRGVDVTTPNSATIVSSQKATATATTAVVTPAITPVHKDCVIVACATTLAVTNAEVPTYTWAGYTERVDTCSSAAAAQNQGATIATGILGGGQNVSQNPPDITTSLNVGRENMYTLALRPAPVAVSGSFVRSDAVRRAANW